MKTDFIAEYIDYLRIVRSVSEMTLKSYSRDLNAFANYCVNRNLFLDNIESADVRGFIADLGAEGMATVSINRALSSIRGFFQWMNRFNHRLDDPSSSLKNLKAQKKLPEFLYEGEMAHFSELPDTSGILWPERDKAMILTMYSAGLRISELVSLTLKNIEKDLSGARVTGKGNKERQVFFSDEAGEALAFYLHSRKKRIPADYPTEKLFINSKGVPISVAGVRWIIARYSQRSGLKKNVHPHALRHTFATHLVNSGCDVRVVQELLGHSSISTTQRYTHVDFDRLKKVYAKAHRKAEKKA